MHATTEAIEDLRILLKNTASELVNAKAKIRELSNFIQGTIPLMICLKRKTDAVGCSALNLDDRIETAKKLTS